MSLRYLYKQYDIICSCALLHSVEIVQRNTAKHRTQYAINSDGVFTLMGNYAMDTDTVLARNVTKFSVGVQGQFQTRVENGEWRLVMFFTSCSNNYIFFMYGI